MAGSIVDDGIGIFRKLDRLLRGVGNAIEDLTGPTLAAVDDEQLVRIGQVENAVRRVEALDAVDGLAAVQVKYLDRVMLLRCEEQPVVLEIDGKVVEIPVDTRHVHGADQSQRSWGVWVHRGQRAGEGQQCRQGSRE